MGPAAGPDPLRGERLLRAVDDLGFDHGAGDVGPAHHATTGDRLHLLPGDAHSQRTQALDHGPATPDPVGDDRLAFGGQCGMRRIGAVGEHVHAVAVQAAGQFHAGYQRQALREGPASLIMPGLGVVVGQRDHIQASGAGPAHHLGGRARPIRHTAVAMEIDAHERSS